MGCKAMGQLKLVPRLAKPIAVVIRIAPIQDLTASENETSTRCATFAAQFQSSHAMKLIYRATFDVARRHIPAL